jgi:hypothetical protein
VDGLVDGGVWAIAEVAKTGVRSRLATTAAVAMNAPPVLA